MDDRKGGGGDDAAMGESFVRLNVGGRIFLTCKSTLLKSPSCMLARMLAVEDQGRMAAGRRDADGAIVIDRSPEYFQPILNFLRTGKVVLDEGVNPEGEN